MIGRYRPIGDYGLVGNSHSAALISRDGSIDWWCPWRFDDPALFAALLDADNGGHFAIRPAGEAEITRRYLDRTNVLQTTFRTETGTLVLTDAMPVMLQEEDDLGILPRSAIVRRLEVTAGEVDVCVDYHPRFDTGRWPATLRDRGAMGVWCGTGREAVSLRSDRPLEVTADRRRAVARHRLVQGETWSLGVAHARGEPLVLAPIGASAEFVLARTAHAWESWLERCTYRGPYEDQVLRSALVLRALIYEPSGAIVAAATTSLPESPGGARNFDYRYCWLRDATMTVVALSGIGFVAEAESFLDWTLHATHLTFPRLQVVYDVYGHTRLEERELDHLEGWRGSRPVRVGNAATDQDQHDLYGEVIGGALALSRGGGELERDHLLHLRGLGEVVLEHWDEPDHGMWEVRGGRRHFVHSKLMCWVAVDGLLKLHEDRRLRLDAARYRDAREAIRRQIEEEGYSERLGHFTSWYGGDEVDASLLQLALHGFLDPDDPRMVRTYEVLRERLSHRGFWHRYAPSFPDGFSCREGAFGLATFWASRYLALAGRLDEAEETFRRGLDQANDLGLLAEEVDPETGELLGNFPQAFSHLGLIQAALALQGTEEAHPEATRERKRHREGA